MEYLTNNCRVRKMLFVIGDNYYEVTMNVTDRVEVDDIVEWIKYREINNIEDLTKVLDDYCESHAKEDYLPNWFYETFEAIVCVN